MKFLLAWRRIDKRLTFVGVCLVGVGILLLWHERYEDGLVCFALAFAKFSEAQWAHLIGQRVPRPPREEG
jgi:hypothetical protein